MSDFNQDRLPDLGLATVTEKELNVDPKAEWHAARLGKLTSSRFEDMMQTGKGKDARFGRMAMIYIYEKVAELLINAPHIVTSQAMEWGTEMEIQAIKKYEEISGLKVLPAGFVPFGEYAGGSPDGLIGDDGIIEVKCPYNPANHVETVITNEVPDKHSFQIQGNLMVTGRQWCDFISYDPRVQEESLQIFIQRVHRDEVLIQAIQDRIKEVSVMVLELFNNLKK
jgi:predicted phage-related endonuclease